MQYKDYHFSPTKKYCSNPIIPTIAMFQQGYNNFPEQKNQKKLLVGKFHENLKLKKGA